MSRSLLYIYEYNNLTKYDFIFPSRTAINTFISAAKQNGFKYKTEALNSNSIVVYYNRNKDYMNFTDRGDVFIVEYFPGNSSTTK